VTVVTPAVTAVTLAVTAVTKVRSPAHPELL